jgi:signal transduction histidine kinase
LEFLRMIDIEADRISALVGQFLDVSSMDSGSAHISFEEFDFAAAIRGLVEVFRVGAGHGRPISLKSHGNPGLCIGDRPRLLQVVEQLFDNVVKFTPDGSAVAIELREHDGTFELQVADHGGGLESDEERQRIFERFVQGGDILTGKPAGVGLGLSLARDVARAHAGDLRCVPNPAGGSVFVLTIPTRPALVTGDRDPVTSPGC